ncbi:hypothetical protein POPTR_002G252050v4 [Populus trichocarpa]|uniref:Uncharacterized protein n=1 Tax=Populus trichocarpa TaxID=3694 RepID=A0ACC0TFU8_POPTR|nr:hypothetical protein POPTR_002G252050v4 [Populus trichocarpa]
MGLRNNLLHCTYPYKENPILQYSPISFSSLSKSTSTELKRVSQVVTFLFVFYLL